MEPRVSLLFSVTRVRPNSTGKNIESTVVRATMIHTGTVHLVVPPRTRSGMSFPSSGSVCKVVVIKFSLIKGTVGKKMR